MRERFSGPEGERLRVDALASQAIIPDAAVAECVSALSEMEYYEIGDQIICDGANDNDLYFILSGTTEVVVRGRVVAQRGAGDHVGEMAALDPSEPRSACVRATSPTACARLTEAGLIRVGAQFPEVWRMIAKGLASRLRERSRFLTPPNDRPRLFVGSAVEGLKLAHAVRDSLHHDAFQVKVWTDGVFGPSGTTCDSLFEELAKTDFALFVVRDDDKTTSRGRETASPRDNVVFELGLFMGALGRERTFSLRPRGIELKVPTDLLGVTPLEYDPRNVEDPEVAVATAANRLRNVMTKLGPR